MPKIKFDGAEDPTINNFYKIDNRKFCLCSLKADRTILTEVDRKISWRQVSSGTHMVIYNIFYMANITLSNNPHHI